ncbi:MAG: DegT/DnrJ/EryC1/StrS family aminotransferase [Planctomycetota bacterium]|nr:DegT/DnrJ/EryC1/StrS family aminotransferase [Planctomycetota bacterium]
MTTTTNPAATAAEQALAAKGGKPVRTAPWPARNLFTAAERDAAVALFDKVIASGSVIGYNGEEEEAYLREFCDFMGGGFADGVNSGSSAVYVALRALDLEPFTEVIVPPVSDPGGVMPVALLNMIPVPADVAPGTYNSGPAQIEARITPRTSAILVAHIAGLPADMEAIMAIGKRHKLPVIEDCAQSHGASLKGKLVGSFGDIAAFSTMSGKHHASGPQGGIVYTRREDLVFPIRRASDRGKPFGLPPGSQNSIASLNLNSNDLAATIGRVQLRKLPGIVAARQKTADALARACESLKAVRLNTGIPGANGAHWFLLLKLDLPKFRVDKAAIAAALQAEGIPVGGGYWHSPATSEWAVKKRVFGTSGYPWNSPLYKGDPNATWELPNAKAADDTHITLAFHERVGEQEVADTVAALAKVEKAYLK